MNTHTHTHTHTHIYIYRERERQRKRVGGDSKLIKAAPNKTAIQVGHCLPFLALDGTQTVDLRLMRLLLFHCARAAV